MILLESRDQINAIERLCCFHRDASKEGDPLANPRNYTSRTKQETSGRSWTHADLLDIKLTLVERVLSTHGAVLWQKFRSESDGELASTQQGPECTEEHCKPRGSLLRRPIQVTPLMEFSSSEGTFVVRNQNL